MRQQHPVIGGHRVEERRSMLLDHCVYIRRRRRTRPQNRRRADAKRKVHAVAEAVREEQLGDAETAIVGRDAQDRFRVQLGAHDHVVMQMHASLRETGAARRVQPEGGIVRARRLRLEIARRLRHQRCQRPQTVRARLCSASNNDVADIAQAVARDRLDVRQ